MICNSSGSGDFEITGSGDANLKVAEGLDISITGNGDIYYIGSPTMNINISGSGRVENIN